jgi:nitrite reductase/ring-hydroxylating ferredoxin subunit
MHGYIFELRTGKLVAPLGLCDDQRPFRATLEGDTITVWDPAEILVIR